MDPTISNRISTKGGLETTTTTIPLKDISTVSKSATASKPCGNSWVKNLTLERLEPFPAYSYVDRNSRYIQGQKASLIVSTLLNYLRLNSIQVKYEEDSPGKFRCKTFDFVSFRINMFTRHVEGAMEPSVLVEIQRRSGCSISFQKVRRSLLCTMDDLSSTNTETFSRRGSLSHTTRCIDPCLTCFEGIPMEMKHENYDTIAEESLSEIQNHLKSDRTDAQILALELLVHLTNPAHTPIQVVKAAASKLLKSNEISESVKTLIVQGKDRSKELEDLDLDLQYDGDFVDNARQMSLCILLNCFEAMSEYLPEILEDSGGWMIENVIPCLVRNLNEVEMNVHVALQSTRVLAILNNNSEDCRQCMLREGVIEVSKHVVEYGTEWHEEIRNEAALLYRQFVRM